MRRIGSCMAARRELDGRNARGSRPSSVVGRNHKLGLLFVVVVEVIACLLLASYLD